MRPPATPNLVGWMERGLRRLLARLTDRENYPAIDAILAAGVFAGPDDPNAEFDFGLERVLDGIDALVRARSASTPTGG